MPKPAFKMAKFGIHPTRFIGQSDCLKPDLIPSFKTEYMKSVLLVKQALCNPILIRQAPMTNTKLAKFGIHPTRFIGQPDCLKPDLILYSNGIHEVCFISQTGSLQPDFNPPGTND
jgi:hypothetical protein